MISLHMISLHMISLHIWSLYISLHMISLHIWGFLKKKVLVSLILYGQTNMFCYCSNSMDMRGRCLPEKIKRCGKNVGVKLIPPIGYYCWRLGRNIGIICKAELYSMWWIKERTWWEVNTTNLRMYFFPIVLNINHSFSNLEETVTHFNQIWIIYIYYIYI